MVQIFQPILHHALIYIDDILLFSGSHDEHRQLLTQFYDIVHNHGIMLSAKKSTIATDNIEFLGMIIKDGHYQPGNTLPKNCFTFQISNFPKDKFNSSLVLSITSVISFHMWTTTLATSRLY